MKITDTGAPSAAPPPKGSATEPRAGSSFDALLTLQSQARTAPAEGPKKTTEHRDTAAPAQDDAPTADTQADAPLEQGQVADATPAPVAGDAPVADQEVAAELAAQAPVVPAVLAIVPIAPAVVPTPPAPQATPAVQVEVEAAASQVPPLPVAAPADAAVPAHAEGDIAASRADLPAALTGLIENRGPAGPHVAPAPPVAAAAAPAPAAAAVAAPAMEPTTAAPSPVPAAPVAAETPATETAPAPAGPAHAKPPVETAAQQRPATEQPAADANTGGGGAQAKDQPAEQQLPAHVSARAVELLAAKPAGEQAAPVADTAPAPPVTATDAAIAPAAPFAPVRAEHAHGGLQLAQTVERLRELVQIATRNGAAHARLHLHPVELGGIEVRLKSVADGVTAKIIADRPEAVAALQQAGADLRRSLEERGVTVLDIEISLSASAGDPGADNAAYAGSSQDGLASDTTTNRRGRDAASDPTSETDELSESERAPRADSGAVLVDVFA